MDLEAIKWRVLVYIVIAVAGYLLGSIPTGYLIGRARGVDIRTVGSGNIGATNVFRMLGKGPGALALVMDGLKGYAASSWLADLVIHQFVVPAAQQEYVKVLGGIAAVLGHSFTCWLKFKGGKGVATSAGVFFALTPLAATISLVTWILLFAVSRYVSVASIAAALALPVTVWLTSDSLVLRAVTTAICLLIILKHKSNVQRLFNGTERRFGRKNPVAEVSE